MPTLKLKIDPYAVSIVPLSVNTDELITKEYKVPAGFMSQRPPLAPAHPECAGSPRRRRRHGRWRTHPVPARQSATRQKRDGVSDGPGCRCSRQGASAVYFPGSSRLIVHNTASNIELIDAIVEASQPPIPTQVSIESKFVEISAAEPEGTDA